MEEGCPLESKPNNIDATKPRQRLASFCPPSHTHPRMPFSTSSSFHSSDFCHPLPSDHSTWFSRQRSFTRSPLSVASEERITSLNVHGQKYYERVCM